MEKRCGRLKGFKFQGPNLKYRGHINYGHEWVNKLWHFCVIFGGKFLWALGLEQVKNILAQTTIFDCVHQVWKFVKDGVVEMVMDSRTWKQGNKDHNMENNLMSSVHNMLNHIRAQCSYNMSFNKK